MIEVRKGQESPRSSHQAFQVASCDPRSRSECRLRADSVEKQCVARAESGTPNGSRAPFLSGFARLLRCRKDLG